MINLTVVIDNEEAVRKFRELQKTAKTVTSSVVTDADRMDIAMRRITTTLGQIGAAASLTGLIRKIALIRGEFQQLEVAFSTLLQSKEKADRLMAEMVDLAAKTPFDLQGVANGARQLLAYGFAAGDITDILTRLGNVAAGLGLPLERLTYLYGTTAVQGRLYARDMLQFQSSGINITGELARMMGKTTSEITAMVSEGKIGFGEVKNAIENMTNEGGKFYNLMQEQSKTITGLISNLGDAIDTMFNDIGKSQEGIITDVLTGTISLVENYEKVLDILIPLVSAYGAYKAALLAIAAIDRVKTTLAATKALLEQTKMLRRATQAQILFNNAVKSNTWGLALSVLTAIGFATYRYTKNSESAARASKELGSAIDEEKIKLDKLYNAINNAKNGTNDRKIAIDNFNQLYGRYLNNLLSEKTAVEDIATAYNKAKSAVVDYAIEKARQSYLSNPMANVDKAKTNLRESAAKWGDKLGNAGAIGGFMADIDKIINRIESGETFNEGTIYKVVTDAFSKQSGGVKDNSFYAIKTKEFAFELQREFGNLQAAAKEFESFSRAYRSASAGKVTNSNDTTNIASLEKTISAAREKLAGLESELADLMAGKLPKGANADFDWIKAIQDKQKAIKEQHEELNTLTGYDPKQVKKSKSNTEKLSEANIQVQRETTQAEIDVMEEGTAKKLAQIDLDYQKRLDAIEKNEKELKDAQGNELSDEQKGWFDRMRNAAEMQHNENRGNILLSGQMSPEDLNNLFDQEVQTWNEYLRQYGTFREKLQATKEEYDNKIAKAKTEGEKASIQAEADQVLAGLEVQASDWARSLIGKTTDELDKMLSDAESKLKEAEDAFNHLDSSHSPEAQQYLATINRLKAEIAQLKNQNQNVKDNASKMNWAEVATGLESIASGARAAAQGLEGLDAGLGQTLNSFVNVASGAAQFANSIAAIGDKASFGNIMGGITAGIGLISSLIGLFSQGESSWERNLRLAREFNEELRVMNERAKINTDAFKTIFGDDEAGNYISNLDALKDALENYLSTLEKIQKRGQEYTTEFGANTEVSNLSKKDRTWENASDSIRNMMVQTRHSTWLRSAKYQSLGSLVPNLFDEKTGEIQMENLKKFVDDAGSTFKHLRRENQDMLKQMVNDWETYQQALDAVNQYMSDIFGDLGRTLNDALVESWENGTDAAEAFGDAAGNVLKNLAKDILYTATIGPAIDAATKKIEEINTNTDLSNEERFKALAEVTDQFLDDVLSQQDMAQGLWDRLKQEAEERGVEWNEVTPGQSTTSRSYQAMSEDTGNELTGRFTDMQNKMNILVSGMDMLRSINMDTRNASIDIRDIMIQLNGNVADIRTFTKVLPDMRNTLVSMNKKLDNL